MVIVQHTRTQNAESENLKVWNTVDQKNCLVGICGSVWEINGISGANWKYK